MMYKANIYKLLLSKWKFENVGRITVKFVRREIYLKIEFTGNMNVSFMFKKEYIKGLEF